jgi:hypothetical protein
MTAEAPALSTCATLKPRAISTKPPNRTTFCTSVLGTYMSERVGSDHDRSAAGEVAATALAGVRATSEARPNWKILSDPDGSLPSSPWWCEWPTWPRAGMSQWWALADSTGEATMASTRRAGEADALPSAVSVLIYSRLFRISTRDGGDGDGGGAGGYGKRQ